MYFSFDKNLGIELLKYFSLETVFVFIFSLETKLCLKNFSTRQEIFVLVKSHFNVFYDELKYVEEFTTCSFFVARYPILLTTPLSRETTIMWSIYNGNFSSNEA